MIYTCVKKYYLCSKIHVTMKELDGLWDAEESFPVKRIDGYAKDYFVSVKGDIYSEGYWHNKDFFILNFKGTLVPVTKLAQTERNGYLTVRLFNNGKIKNLTVHRIVASLFVINPDNKPIVNHKDGNKKNNYANNLEWCTQKQNINHAIDIGLIDYSGINRSRKFAGHLHTF